VISLLFEEKHRNLVDGVTGTFMLAAVVSIPFSLANADFERSESNVDVCTPSPVAVEELADFLPNK